MVDLSTTLSSFESEVNKALRILTRKLKENANAGSGATKGETTEKDLKFQCEKKLKEVFDYYKTRSRWMSSATSCSSSARRLIMPSCTA